MESQKWEYNENSSRFPFIMNVMFMGLFIMPPHVNTQFAAGSSIAKLR